MTEPEERYETGKPTHEFADPGENVLTFHPTHKAEIDMGGMTAFINKRINWFHRLMIRACFGWKVTNVE